MSGFKNVIQGAYSLLLPAVRSTTQTINGLDVLDPQVNGNRTGITQGLSGLLLYLNVTAAPGIDTITLVVEELDLLSNVWQQIAATLPTTATGMIKFKMFPSISPVAASVTGITLNDVLPNVWRIRIVHSAATNWTYTLRMIGYN